LGDVPPLLNAYHQEQQSPHAYLPTKEKGGYTAMSDESKKGHLRPWEPATYRIEVEGLLEESWSDRFAGMRIQSRKRADASIVTCLTGRLMDQSELTGVLNNLAELHLPILRVENIDEEIGHEVVQNSGQVF
jgi:hypothetical protein